MSVQDGNCRQGAGDKPTRKLLDRWHQLLFSILGLSS